MNVFIWLSGTPGDWFGENQWIDLESLGDGTHSYDVMFDCFRFSYWNYLTEVSA